LQQLLPDGKLQEQTVTVVPKHAMLVVASL
jgi:hypothetical protein